MIGLVSLFPLVATMLLSQPDWKIIVPRLSIIPTMQALPMQELPQTPEQLIFLKEIVPAVIGLRMLT